MRLVLGSMRETSWNSQALVRAATRSCPWTKMNTHIEPHLCPWATAVMSSWVCLMRRSTSIARSPSATDPPPESRSRTNRVALALRDSKASLICAAIGAAISPCQAMTTVLLPDVGPLTRNRPCPTSSALAGRTWVASMTAMATIATETNMAIEVIVPRQRAFSRRMQASIGKPGPTRHRRATGRRLAQLQVYRRG